MGASKTAGLVESISAVTLLTQDMSSAVSFYKLLGFELARGGEDAAFSTFRAGTQYLNLSMESADQKETSSRGVWGRTIFYVRNVDDMYRVCLEAELEPSFAPRNAVWGERYFHIVDPDGNELSFARPILP